MTQKKNILFLCTGNSCRSQMAEGLCRHHRGTSIAPFSAGIEKHGLNPLAVKVMAEIGIDISSHFSKTLDDIDVDSLDLVVTVCGHAHETCPVLPGPTKVVHHGFDDPPFLARGAESEEEALVHYRRVRDEIADYIQSLELC
jgi:arsenate reductase